MSGKKDSDLSGFLVNFMMGGVSAAVSKTAAAPIERVKLLLQNQGEMLKTGRLDKPYKGIFDCVNRVVKEESIISLWRGNTANVLRYFPTQALNFAFKDKFKAMSKTPKDASYTRKFFTNMASGGLAGASSLAIVYPLDYARTRLANDNKSSKSGGQRQFKGLADVCVKAVKSDGAVGLYRGFVISCVGIVVYRGFYFGFYDSIKPVVLVGKLHDSFLASLLLGWGVTIGAAFLSYPLDTVRRRMMMTSGEAVKYRGSIHAFTEIVKHDGVTSLFKGAGVNVFRGIAGAGVLAGYDWFKLLLFPQEK